MGIHYFPILFLNIYCGYSLESPCGGSKCTLKLCFERNIKKISFSRLKILTFTAFVLRHFGIMKTSESDSTKKLIKAISTNLCCLVFFYQKEDILILSTLKNELNEVEFLQVFIHFLSLHLHLQCTVSLICKITCPCICKIWITSSAE